MFSVGLLPANSTSCLIYGIVGIINLVYCPYLIVITKASQIGLIEDEPIYRMEQVQLIPFLQNLPNPREGQIDWNGIYLSMLESVLHTPNYYFSYTYDLTNTIQRAKSNRDAQKEPIGDRAHIWFDKRFLWNSHVMTAFDACGDVADKYRLPFIMGFVSINKIEIGQGFHWTLISRRSIHRAGTRFNSRGIDHDGNVSNFVETEQILEGPFRGSHVQVRGSIPLVWSQKVNYKYKPAIEINPEYDHSLFMRKHFDDLRDRYCNVSVVNLIDHKGHEGDLEREFSQQMSYLNKYYQVPYHYFDFHKECSKMRWHRLSILMERIHQEIDSYGYFASFRDEVIQQQNGVIRSNCIDSLDRTNVVQSMIAQHVLEMQLQCFKYTPIGTSLSDLPDFMETFKNIWADNADALSIQYAGTPALKTDFTRTGQRTQFGLVRDGINSLTRYISNNFFDSYRQDAIDLFLGHYEGYPSPLYKPMDLTNYTSPLPVTVVILTLFILYVYLRY